MNINMLPPFIIRKQGIQVQEIPKIQTPKATISDHSIYFSDTGFRIPLSLWGIFSYFPTRKPSVQDLTDIDEVYLLTPSRFNPHDPSYAINESQMTDWEGEIVEPRNRQQILLSEIPEDIALSALLTISISENEATDARLCSIEIKEQVCLETILPVPHEADEIGSVLSSISPVLDAATLYQYLSARVFFGKASMFGSTQAPNLEFLEPGDDNSTVNDTHRGDNVSGLSTSVVSKPQRCEAKHRFARMTRPYTRDQGVRQGANSASLGVKLPVARNDEGKLAPRLHRDVNNTHNNIKSDHSCDVNDPRETSAASATRVRGVSPEHLSKVWRIDHGTAKRTLEVTTQLVSRKDDPKLSRNYGTGDCVLRYRRVERYFSMDIFLHQERWHLVSRTHLLPSIRDGPRFCVCRPYEVQVRGIAGGQTVHERGWSP